MTSFWKFKNLYAFQRKHSLMNSMYVFFKFVYDFKRKYENYEEKMVQN